MIDCVYLLTPCIPHIRGLICPPSHTIFDHMWEEMLRFSCGWGRQRRTGYEETELVLDVFEPSGLLDGKA